MWPAAILLLFLAGFTNSFGIPLSTTQKSEQSYLLAKETSTYAPIAGWPTPAPPTLKKGTWMDTNVPAATIGQTSGSFTDGFEESLPTNHDKAQSSWWSKETSTLAPDPGQWLTPAVATSSRTMVPDKIPDGNLQESIALGPTAAQSSGGLPKGFEQPMQLKPDKAQSAWWPMEKSTSTPAVSISSLIAASDNIPNGSLQGATVSGHISSQVSGFTRGFEQPLPIKQDNTQSSWWSMDTSTTALKPGEWLAPGVLTSSLTAAGNKIPDGSLQKATFLGPTNDQTSGGFELPLPIKQNKAHTSWWPKETSTPAPKPGEWLAPAVSISSLTTAYDKLTDGSVKETTVLGPTASQVSGFTRGLEQPLPIKQDKTQSSWWSTETSASAPLGEWLTAAASTPRENPQENQPLQISSITHLPSTSNFSAWSKVPHERDMNSPIGGNKDMPHISASTNNILYSKTDAPLEFDNPNTVASNLQSMKIEGSVTSTYPSPLFDTYQAKHTSMTKPIETNYPSKLETDTFKPNRPISIDIPVALPSIGGVERSPDLRLSQPFPESSSKVIELINHSEIKTKTFKPESNPSSSIDDTNRTQAKSAVHTPVLGKPQPFTTSSSNVIGPPSPSEININTSDPESGEPSSMPSTPYGIPTPIDVTSRPGTKGSSNLVTSQPLTTMPSNFIDHTSPSGININTSDPASDEPSASFGIPIPIEVTSQPPMRGSGRSPILATSRPLPNSPSKVIEPNSSEIISNPSKLEKDAPYSMTTVSPSSVPIPIEVTSRPPLRGSGRSPVLATPHPLSTSSSKVIEPNNSSEMKSNPSKPENDTLSSMTTVSPSSVPIPIEVTSRPPVRGSGRSPVLATPHPLLTSSSKVIEPNNSSEQKSNPSKPENDAPSSMTTVSPSGVPIPIDVTSRPPVRGSGRSPVLATRHPLPTSTSITLDTTNPLDVEYSTSKPDPPTSAPSKAPIVAPKENERSPLEEKGSKDSSTVDNIKSFPSKGFKTIDETNIPRRPLVRGNGRSVIAASSGDPHSHGMTKATLSFVPLAPLGRPRTPTGDSLQMPIEHVVVEIDDGHNENDLETQKMLFPDEPIDQKPVANQDIYVHNVLEKGEPKQYTNEDHSERNSLNPEINVANDLHFDTNENYHIAAVGNHDTTHHHTAHRDHLKHHHYIANRDHGKKHHHTVHGDHGLKHHHHKNQGEHGQKHHHHKTQEEHGLKHHASARSHHGELQPTVEYLTLSINNNPSSGVTAEIESLNSYNDLPAIAYYLYHPSNFLF